MRILGTILVTSLMLAACQRPAEVPSPKRIVALEYPRLALAAGIRGSVRVQVTIDGNGNVQDVMPIEGEGVANHPLLYPGVRENVLKWKFDESRSNNPQTSRILTYTFKIEGATREERKKQEFVFEQPDGVLITSEGSCPDHLPCNEEEAKNWKQ
jgi:TonB family protein